MGLTVNNVDAHSLIKAARAMDWLARAFWTAPDRCWLNSFSCSDVAVFDLDGDGAGAGAWDGDGACLVLQKGE
jgi:hypothetical protein